MSKTIFHTALFYTKAIMNEKKTRTNIANNPKKIVKGQEGPIDMNGVLPSL